jgi:pyrroline-5-carboxylate reductase
MTLAFIGAGKMATAIASGLVDHKVFASDAILATDVYEPAREAFSARTGATCSCDNAAVVAQADAIVLSVKPQVAAQVLAPLKGSFADKLFISIAAGLSIDSLAAWTGAGRIIRVMPNTPAMVATGASVFSCAPAVTETDRELARRIFGAIGIVHEMPEPKLDAVTGLSGSGPAYVFEFIQALVDGGVAAGLDAESAHELVVQTVAGAAEMLRQGMGTPDELRTAVTSPGGTTAAGLSVMADANFRDIMSQVVARATARSIELGQA